MTPHTLLHVVIRPTLELLARLPAALGLAPSSKAEVLLLAIALQESGLRYRAQVPVAHALGFWQFERGHAPGAGVRGVCEHPASRPRLAAVCATLTAPQDIDDIHHALRYGDVLACAVARLLLWTDPAPLPDIHDSDTAWRYYLRNWRPGKPHPDTWAACHAAALDTVTGAPA